MKLFIMDLFFWGVTMVCDSAQCTYIKCINIEIYELVALGKITTIHFEIL